MKKLLLSIAIVFAANIATQAHNHDELTVKIKVSTVEWIGKKVTGQHNGSINIKEGKLYVHDGVIERGKIMIDMTTIQVLDLEGEWAGKLKGHLESDDFFDVKNHDVAVFEIKKVTKGDKEKSKVDGILTIKGISHPISFDANIEMKDGKLAAYAEVTVDRTLYDIKYGSGKFFEGLGDKMIDDNFIIKFKIAAE